MPIGKCTFILAKATFHNSVMVVYGTNIFNYTYRTSVIYSVNCTDLSSVDVTLAIELIIKQRTHDNQTECTVYLY